MAGSSGGRVVPKGVLKDEPHPPIGLRACCHAEYDDSVHGKALKDGCSCNKPCDKCALVECVSCTMKISGQHACSKCHKLMCNFCAGEEEDEALKVCRTCKPDPNVPLDAGDGNAEPGAIGAHAHQHQSMLL